VKASPAQTAGLLLFQAIMVPASSHAVECFDNDRLDGVLSDLANQAVAHGVLLQHGGSVMQIEFADGVEVRTASQHAQNISSAVGAAFTLRRIAMTRLPW
jgi:hypothetical protein